MSNNKMKTHKGAKKRFKVTGSGKIRRRQSGLNHFNSKMSSRVKRRLGGPELVDATNMKQVKELLSS
ncbi:MAG: 50S ribosomal protein L35 [Acidimicrobiales bacterium]